MPHVRLQAAQAGSAAAAAQAATVASSQSLAVLLCQQRRRTAHAAVDEGVGGMGGSRLRCCSSAALQLHVCCCAATVSFCLPIALLHLAPLALELGVGAEAVGVEGLVAAGAAAQWRGSTATPNLGPSGPACSADTSDRICTEMWGETQRVSSAGNKRHWCLRGAPTDAAVSLASFKSRHLLLSRSCKALHVQSSRQRRGLRR